MTKSLVAVPSINKLIIIIVVFNEFNACTSRQQHNGGHDTLIMTKMATTSLSTVTEAATVAAAAKATATVGNLCICG